MQEHRIQISDGSQNDVLAGCLYCQCCQTGLEVNLDVIADHMGSSLHQVNWAHIWMENNLTSSEQGSATCKPIRT